MTIGMRGRRPLGMIAVAVVLLLVVLGFFAWRAGGPQPIGEVVMPIAVPGAGQ